MDELHVDPDLAKFVTEQILQVLAIIILENMTH